MEIFYCMPLGGVEIVFSLCLCSIYPRAKGTVSNGTSPKLVWVGIALMGEPLASFHLELLSVHFGFTLEYIPFGSHLDMYAQMQPRQKRADSKRGRRCWSCSTVRL